MGVAALELHLALLEIEIGLNLTIATKRRTSAEYIPDLAYTQFPKPYPDLLPIAVSNLCYNPVC
jgi:hypothetical protein